MNEKTKEWNDKMRVVRERENVVACINANGIFHLKRSNPKVLLHGNVLRTSEESENSEFSWDSSGCVVPMRIETIVGTNGCVLCVAECDEWNFKRNNF